MKLLNYCQGLTMTNRAFDELFGGPPRDPESTIEQRHMDLAASIQAVTEDVMLAIGRELFRQTGMSRLVLAGGVALNCVGNGRLLREGRSPTSGYSRRPATPAARLARRCSSGISFWRSRAPQTAWTARRGVSSARLSIRPTCAVSWTASARNTGARPTKPSSR